MHMTSSLRRLGTYRVEFLGISFAGLGTLELDLEPARRPVLNQLHLETSDRSRGRKHYTASAKKAHAKV